MKTYVQAQNNEGENTPIIDEVPKPPHNKNYRIDAKDKKY